MQYQISFRVCKYHKTTAELKNTSYDHQLHKHAKPQISETTYYFNYLTDNYPLTGKILTAASQFLDISQQSPNTKLKPPENQKPHIFKI